MPPNFQIPVIDISTSNPDAPAQLLDAAAKYGFVFVENNEAGIPESDISHMFECSRDFFAAPTEVKEQVSINSNKAGKNHGWLSRGVENLDESGRRDVKEAFNLGEPVDNIPQQPIPVPLQPHTQRLLAFHDACHALCSRILTHFATALGLEEAWFTSRHDRMRGRSGTILRLLYYPHVNAGDIDAGVDIRAGAHSDYGSITLLFQQEGQPGLEILGPLGEWAGVPVNPAREGRPTSTPANTNDAGVAGKRALPILVNIGDLLEDWTGGLLKSTVHRVIFPKEGSKGQDRYSIAYFCHPLDEAELTPVPSRLVQEHAAATGKGSTRDGKVLTAKDHLMERLAATYKVK